jgi:hypothetical protein
MFRAGRLGTVQEKPVFVCLLQGAGDAGGNGGGAI